MSTTQDKAFTIWTRPAMRYVQLATSTEYGIRFGIAHFGEVWFRFGSRALHCHCIPGKTDASAIMERRGN